MPEVAPQDFLEVIKIRRTIRHFKKDQPVPLDKLERILQAGTWAPYSPYFPQGWKFIALKGKLRDQAVAIITQSKTVLKYLRQAYEHSPYSAEAESPEEKSWKEFARDFAQSMGNAPVIIVGLVPRHPALSIQGHNLGSAWAAVQNMMLQATSERLASGVVTFHSPSVEKQLIRFLNLAPENWVVAFVLNVGYPDETPVVQPRKAGLYEIRE